MGMNLIVIGIVLLVAYIWAGQGAFSAFIHFICTLVAGAVAFAIWEPLTTSFFLGSVPDFAWAAGLLAPFAITLVLLRVAADKLITANLAFDDATNFVGGALFGAGSGIIAAGFVALGVGLLRVPHDFMGYTPASYDPNTGSVVEGKGLWVPADRLTAGLYERLSVGSFSTAAPLALRMPDLPTHGGGLRMTYSSAGRNAFGAEDVTLLSRYTVMADSTDLLLKDAFNLNKEGQPVVQKVKLPSGEDLPAGARLEGFVLRFEAKAKEKNGQVMVGAGQFRLIAANEEGDAIAVHPIAVIAQTSGDARDYARFRFDAPEVFIASVGGASTATMAFEFPVPRGYTPTDLLVKGVRLPIDASVPRVAGEMDGGFVPPARDLAVRSGDLLGVGGGAAGRVDTSSAARVSSTDASGFTSADAGIRQTANITTPFNISYAQGLEIVQGAGRSGNENLIVRGKQTFRRDQLGGNLPNSLRVTGFMLTSDTAMMQVDVSLNSKLSLLGQSVQTAQSVTPPLLIDSIGQQYNAVGWIFEQGDTVEFRYTPDQPIRGLAEIPTLSRSRPDQRLTLLFVVSENVGITKFALGSSAVATFEPPITVRALPR